jgi:hypothetical protein
VDNPIQLGKGMLTNVHEMSWAQADEATAVILRNTISVLSQGGAGRAYGGARRGSSASAPGSPPAIVSGEFVRSFVPFIEETQMEFGFGLRFGVQSVGLPYAGEFDPKFSGYTGGKHFAARPFVDAVMEMSAAELAVIYAKSPTN